MPAKPSLCRDHCAGSLLVVCVLQKALVLDQECSVLADQEVKLENRISFE